MAKVLLVGIEPTAAQQLRYSLTECLHHVESKPADLPADDLGSADIVFVGGKPADYLPLLRRVRRMLPRLPFIVLTRLPETSEWIDALEAGATDYFSFPLSQSQLQWLMESVRPSRAAAAV